MSDNNYDVIREVINEILRKIYKSMNDYIEYVLNSPSTINRIFRYYAVGLPDDPTVPERYIMFGGTIVRKYVFEMPEVKECLCM